MVMPQTQMPLIRQTLTQAVVSPEVPVIPLSPALASTKSSALRRPLIVAHLGIDFEVNNGTPIQAVVTGRIASVSTHPAYGQLVRLVRPDKVESLVLPPVGRGRCAWPTSEAGRGPDRLAKLGMRRDRIFILRFARTDFRPIPARSSSPLQVFPASHQRAKPYREKLTRGCSMVNKKHEYVPGLPSTSDRLAANAGDGVAVRPEVRLRVNRGIFHPNLEAAVRPGGVAGHPHDANHLPCLHDVALADLELIEVSHPDLHLRPDLDLEHWAIGPGPPAGHDHTISCARIGEPRFVTKSKPV